MRVLMFGWEFPPHITGGLGTACYGLTKGLSEMEDLTVCFVVPKVFGDEDRTNLEIVGANKIKINHHQIQFGNVSPKTDCCEVESGLIPYIDPEEYWKMKSMGVSETKEVLIVGDDGTINFSGKYGKNLFEEVAAYADVAALIAEKQDFDVIHAHDWLTYPAGIAASRISGKPLVVHVHSTDFDRNGGKQNPRVYAIEKEGMEAAGTVIAVSNLTRKMIIEKYGIDPKKVVTIHNGVEPLEKTDEKPFRKNFDEKLVTFLGRVTMQKGPGYFVEAAKLVLDKHDNVRFVMAGHGDQINVMIKRAAELRITDRFHFTGFLSDSEVVGLYQMSDVFVMPSVSEPFGIVPLEAMLHGIPVIISNQSGVSEVLNYALKVDFWNTAAMADAISGLITYPALRHMSSTLGKAEAEQLQWKESAQKVRNIYTEVVDNQIKDPEDL